MGIDTRKTVSDFDFSLRPPSPISLLRLQPRRRKEGWSSTTLASAQTGTNSHGGINQPTGGSSSVFFLKNAASRFGKSPNDLIVATMTKPSFVQYETIISFVLISCESLIILRLCPNEVRVWNG
ncbi:hypothetical protein FCM35_KLT12962 [Carex littledalei]|uniref:Uncharacterized protein n=1 Tax=Carex littledalei TaxID=544730 RepID=A0A833QP03_9POAL|nr:hypothetical protein FCM35_KLT12962 [Carex littledalei]